MNVNENDKVLLQLVKEKYPNLISDLRMIFKEYSKNRSLQFSPSSTDHFLKFNKLDSRLIYYFLLGNSDFSKTLKNFKERKFRIEKSEFDSFKGKYKLMATSPRDLLSLFENIKIGCAPLISDNYHYKVTGRKFISFDSSVTRQQLIQYIQSHPSLAGSEASKPVSYFAKSDLKIDYLIRCVFVGLFEKEILDKKLSAVDVSSLLMTFVFREKGKDSRHEKQYQHQQIKLWIDSYKRIAGLCPDCFLRDI